MKKLITGIALLSCATAAFADRPHTHYDYAKVTDVRPIYESYTHKSPRRECWTETVRYDRDRDTYRSATGTILGGVIGAAVGNELGHKKRNKQVGAVAGAVLGASIGRDVSNRHRAPAGVEYRDVERCETRYDRHRERRVSGYDVRYRYRGQEHSTRMDHHPGKKIRVAVSVRPAH
ncbi:glycine zipper 2TM domain-containing protein [Gilvimarinus sp. F26214L]|uniref:glycine zipper 2TM domain-containing protein n=1 Tax=Gilvimarinus sp. DZF01 TaxID=3461371 RepID=UPI004045693A